MKHNLTLVAVGLLTTLACSPSKKFSTAVETQSLENQGSSDSTSGSSDNVIHITNGMVGKLDTPFTVKSGSLGISFEPTTETAINESENVRPPLDVSFVLDVTSSMGLQLEASKKGFKSFMENLKSEGFDAKFSLYTFEDTVTVQTSLTDFDSFQTKLSGISLGKGLDIAEASLLALQTAMSDGASHHRSDAVPVVILVTDAVGHNGGGSASSRDCTLDKTIASFSSDYGKASKLFYAVPTDKVSGSGDCYSSNTNVPYDNLFKAIQAQSTSSSDFRGQSLGWPFEEETLTTELPKLLKEKISSRSVSCSATSYVLKAGSEVLSQGEASSLGTTSSGKPLIANALSSDKLESMIGKSLSMDITRCCDETKTEGSCKSEKVQSVEFVLSK